MPKFYLGLDLGGTNVKAGVVDEHGRILDQISMPTGSSPPDLSAERVIGRMIEAGIQAMEKAGVSRRHVAAVGVLSPGQASLARGIVFRSANLPLWRNVALRKRVSRGLGLRAVLENDASAAAYGEWWAGAGSAMGRTRLDNLFLFTLGTGIGGGLVYEGKVVRGSFDFATEVGHWIMIPGGEPCGCGQRGCLERYCSAKYTAQRANRQLARSRTLRRSSTLGEVFEKAGEVTSADIVVHAQSGDAFALEIWDETCRLLALACINVCHMIDPQMIVLGGGMSQAGRFLLDRVIRHFKSQWWKMTRPTARIVLARLGNDAGIIGAAGVAKEAAERGALPAVGR
jgi:glucokinase